VTLRVDGVSKKLAGKRVVDDVSFDCDDGRIAAISGPNGAGKSTLLRMIAGVLEPDAGGSEIDGSSIVGARVEARRKLGYVPEAADPPGHLTCRELFDLVAALRGAPPLEREVSDRLAIEEIAHRRIERLSLGQRRRACLAAALIGQPAVLVLDEPTNGLDDGGIATLGSLLTERRAAGAAIVFATHDAAFAQSIADMSLRMERGTLTAEG
jgi:ABC-type multidrug transport system ATPase subunit